MKYSISHVLAGISIKRQQDIDCTAEEILAKGRAIEKTKQRAALALKQLKELTLMHVSTMDQLTAYWKTGSALVIPDSDKIVRNAPTEFELLRNEEQIRDLQTRKERLEAQAASADTGLELFLRAVQAGGETHITQHGLKVAGFDNLKISHYIIAHNQESTVAQNA